MSTKNVGLAGSAAIPHQLVITYLNTNINNYLFFSKDNKFNKIVSSPETKFKYEREKRKESDILIFDFTNEKKIYVWVEVCKKGMVSRDKAKIDFIFEHNSTLKEGFVFDYTSNTWHKRTRGGDFSIN